ncbi:hypothetical protein CRUP_020095, partial [Coryphaenoides rupestris]
VSILSSFESRLMQLENSIIPVSILSSFESRLMQLENSIIPVHKQTENLQRLQENVDKTLSCMDHVISYYHKARFEKGKELLEAEFRNLLTRYSKPVPPILILDALTVDEELELQDDVTLEHLPEANSASSGVLYSPAVQTKRKDTPTKKAPKRPGHDHDPRVKHHSEALSEKHGGAASGKWGRRRAKTTLTTSATTHSHEALDNLMLEGDNIVSAARRAIMRHDYSAVLTIFPILKHLKYSKAEFDTTLQNDPDKEYNMPKDGTVHELTSNAILFLQQLLDFHETAGAMLASQGDQLISQQLRLRFQQKAPQHLNLLSKSKVYEDSALSAIFLHNNYNYILKSLEKSDLIGLVKVTQKKAETSYRELIEQQIQLKDKERQVIKDKFKGFNDGLEDLCKTQKGWAIPDKEQRDFIRQAQKRVVSEGYRAFLHRCANIQFTKNPEKYHKYRPDQVEEMIERLFDTSA